jgi:hypothetical protein
MIMDSELVIEIIKKNNIYIEKIMETHHLFNSLKAFRENNELINEHFFKPVQKRLKKGK